MSNLLLFFRRICMFLTAAAYLLTVCCLTLIDSWAEFYAYFFLAGSVSMIFMFVLILWDKDTDENRRVMEDYNRNYSMRKKG